MANRTMVGIGHWALNFCMHGGFVRVAFMKEVLYGAETSRMRFAEKKCDCVRNEACMGEI